jgi:hypothetical protein
MHKDPDTEIAILAASVTRGCVVAAAGCGKTEQIARSVQHTDGRRLLLTHTHAGVDVLRARLKRHQVSSEKFHIDTIAGWCLRYSASFPKRSGLTCHNPKDNYEWNAVYEAAERLIKCGAVKGVLTSTYSGLFWTSASGYQGDSRLSPGLRFRRPTSSHFRLQGAKPRRLGHRCFSHFWQSWRDEHTLAMG